MSFHARGGGSGGGGGVGGGKKMSVDEVEEGEVDLEVVVVDCLNSGWIRVKSTVTFL